MRLISPVVTIDVDIESCEAGKNALILSGFAGTNDVEVRVSGREAWRLMRLFCRPRVIFFLIRSLVSGP